MCDTFVRGTHGPCEAIARRICAAAGGDQDACAICLEKFGGCGRHVLRCGHMFHNTCLAGLKATTIKCPLCRQEDRHMGVLGGKLVLHD